MRWNTHSRLVGAHAFLSASKYHWVNYDDEKMERVFTAAMAAKRGTELHTLAHDLIRLGVKLPQNRKTLNSYVNDAIGFRMQPEVVLYYSDFAFGTADSIGFRDNYLRISDLKTGITRTSVTQLEVYAALFCLEYEFNPFELDGINLRIYQSDEIQEYLGDPDTIMRIMSKIRMFNARLVELSLEVP